MYSMYVYKYTIDVNQDSWVGDANPTKLYKSYSTCDIEHWSLLII